MYVYACVPVWVSATVHGCWPEDTCRRSWLSPSTAWVKVMNSESQILRPGGECTYLLSCLTDSTFCQGLYVT